jgi:hypothetical protein
VVAPSSVHCGRLSDRQAVIGFPPHGGGTVGAVYLNADAVTLSGIMTYDRQYHHEYNKHTRSRHQFNYVRIKPPLRHGATPVAGKQTKCVCYDFLARPRIKHLHRPEFYLRHKAFVLFSGVKWYLDRVLHRIDEARR